MKKIFTYMMMTIVTMTLFTSCEEEDGYIATTLRNRDWQGYITRYYQNRWRLSGDSYATVMRFESKDEFYTSGRGYEVDFDTRSPYRDYAYCSFKWFIVDGEITLIYDDSKWNPIYIRNDYYLSTSQFSGYILDGSYDPIRFEFYSEGDFAGWDRYRSYSTGNYGDFRYYNGREMKMDDFDATAEQPVVLNRTEQVRQETGIADAVSVASGSFAKAMMEE